MTQANYKGIRVGRREFMASTLVGSLAAADYANTPVYQETDSFSSLVSTQPTVADSLGQYYELIRKLPSAFDKITFDTTGISRALAAVLEMHGFFSVDFEKKMKALLEPAQESVKRLPTSSIQNVRYKQTVADVALLNLVATCLDEIIHCEGEVFQNNFPQLIAEVITKAKSLERTQREVEERAGAVEKVSLQLFARSLPATSTFTRFFRTQTMRTRVQRDQETLHTLDKYAVSPEQKEALEVIHAGLTGCLAWMDRGGFFNQWTRSISLGVSGHHPSLYAGARARGLWGKIREVLEQHLPDYYYSRALCCLFLVSPILIGYADRSTRISVISKVLAKLYPAGRNDDSESNRRAAAEALAAVDP